MLFGINKILLKLAPGLFIEQKVPPYEFGMWWHGSG